MTVLAVFLGSFAAAEAFAAAQVVYMTGSVLVESQDGSTRTPRCGELLDAGELLITSKIASAGLLQSGVFVRLGAASELRISVSSGPLFLLVSGNLRVMDGRQSGEPTRVLSTTDQTSELGSDAQVRIVDGGLEVCQRGDSSLAANCSRTAADGTTRTRRAKLEWSPLSGDGKCLLELAGMPRTGGSLPSVAAPPPGSTREGSQSKSD